MPLSEKESPQMRGKKRGTPLKRRYFAAIGSSNMKMVADSTDILLIITSTGDEPFRNVNINDLKRL